MGRLTLQLVDEEGFATAPFGVQPDTDRGAEGGITEYICDRAAVDVVTLDTVLRVEMPCSYTVPHEDSILRSLIDQISQE